MPHYSAWLTSCPLFIASRSLVDIFHLSYKFEFGYDNGLDYYIIWDSMRKKVALLFEWSKARFQSMASTAPIKQTKSRNVIDIC